MKVEPGKPDRPAAGLARAGFVVLGCLMLALAVIGAVLPVMPTTIFLILAAWCFGRSSPRLEAWMLHHPRFGPALREWRAHGAIPRRAKYLACAGMAVGYALFFLGAHPGPWLAVGVAALIAIGIAYVVTRPEPLEKTETATGDKDTAGKA